MTKNAFYLILKALFILKKFKLLPDFFGHALTRKLISAHANAHIDK